MTGAPPARACSPERWRETRRVMGRHRPELARLAGGLYPDLARAGTTPLLARPEWLPAEPLPLDRVALSWQPHPPPVAVTGTGPEAAHVLPDRPGGGRYAGYSEAIAGLDPPALLANRACYRLLGGSLTAASPGLMFTRCRYFDAVNLGHAAGHEFAAAWQRDGAAAGWPGLPLRAAAGDPCDLPRRAAITAVTALTLRREPAGAASFVLHWRDPAKVNHAGGMYQVMPAGIFQPVAGTAASEAADLSLWRCLARELSEEFLGTSEDYPLDGGRLDYQRWPFYLELERARADGLLRVWCLGLGVDPLTLATDILAVAVLDSRAFDALLGGMVAANAEGEVVTEDGSAAIPFTADTVGRFGGGAEPVQPAGAALLQLAWRHRRALLG